MPMSVRPGGVALEVGAAAASRASVRVPARPAKGIGIKVRRMTPTARASKPTVTSPRVV